MLVNSVKMFSVMPSFGDIDTHAHEGNWLVQNQNGCKPGVKNYGYNDILALIDSSKLDKENNISKILVSNTDCLLRKENKDGGFPFLKDEIAGNTEILTKNSNDKRFAYYAVCQPGYGDVKNIKKVFADNPDSFVGLKFHSQNLEINADDARYEPYMAFAKERKLPCLFHSGVAVDWSKNEKGEDIGKAIEDVKKWDSSDPRFIYNLAKKFPDVPVILGHTGAGGAPAHDVAIDVLMQSIKNKDANLYAEVSWMNFKNDLPSDKPESIIKLIKALKNENALDRIIFGSDAPLGCYGEKNISNVSHDGAYEMTISKLKSAIRNDSELKPDAEKIIKMLFNDNAEALFFNAKTVDEVPKKVNSEKPKVAEATAPLVEIDKPGVTENIENTAEDIAKEGENLSEKSSKWTKGKIGLLIAGVLVAGAGIYSLAKYLKAKKQVAQTVALQPQAQTESQASAQAQAKFTKFA